MNKIFFGLKNRNQYIQREMNAMFDMFISKLDTYSINGVYPFKCSKLDITDSYPTYNIDVYGTNLYRLINKERYIRVDYIYSGYDGIAYDDVFDYSDICGIYSVKPRYNIDALIDNQIHKMLRESLYGYIRSISSELNGNTGKLSIDKMCESIEIGYGLTLNKSTTDSRYIKLYKSECEIYEEIRMSKLTSFEEAHELISSMITRIKNKIALAQSKYDSIKDAVGGVVINLDGDDVLCHKSFKPLITGGFITFKCPYTGSMVSMKSTKYDCVVVTGMDEVYGMNDSIVLIGNC